LQKTLSAGMETGRREEVGGTLSRTGTILVCLIGRRGWGNNFHFPVSIYGTVGAKFVDLRSVGWEQKQNC